MYHRDLSLLSTKLKEVAGPSLFRSFPTHYDYDGDDFPPLRKKLHENSDSEIEAVTTFEDLNLSPELIKGLYEEMKFERPCKIQSVCLPMILTPPYNNLVAQGCNFPAGKTTCHVMAMLSRVDPNLSAPQALCLCPYAPIANEIMEVIRKMEKFTSITSELCPYSFNIPKSAPPLTSQVIIGSPEIVDPWIASNKLATSNLKIVVFDDASLTLLSCEEDSVRIVQEIVRWSPKCQILVFSRLTDSDDYMVRAFVSRIVKDLPVQEFHQVSLDEEQPLSLDSVKQYNVNVLDEPSKIRVIKDKILGLGDGVRQTIIYVETRESAEMLHQSLYKDGYGVTTILDTLFSDKRIKINKEFRDGLIQVLIACSLSTTGIDLSQVNLVINYRLPLKYGFSGAWPDHEEYLCRLRRAAQFGRKVALFNLICGDGDRMIMIKIARRSNYHITELPPQSQPSDDDFKDALKKAGLIGIGL